MRKRTDKQAAILLGRDTAALLSSVPFSFPLQSSSLGATDKRVGEVRFSSATWPPELKLGGFLRFVSLSRALHYRCTLRGHHWQGSEFLPTSLHFYPAKSKALHPRIGQICFSSLLSDPQRPNSHYLLGINFEFRGQVLVN